MNKRACYWCARYEARSQLDKVPTCIECAKCFSIPLPTINEPIIEPTINSPDEDEHKFDYKHWFNQYGNTED